MDKKEKFVKLVELESQMKAKGNPRYRKNVVKNVYLAMELDNKDIPEEDMYNKVIEFVELLSGQIKDVEWLSDKGVELVKNRRGIKE